MSASSKEQTLNVQRSTFNIQVEAGAGIEPANGGFADLGLTTWLPRRKRRGKYRTSRCGVNAVMGSREENYPFALSQDRQRASCALQKLLGLLRCGCDRFAIDLDHAIRRRGALRETRTQDGGRVVGEGEESKQTERCL
ncbi:MAG: hypothetical protein QOG48_2534 [Verrucomicrobiota bacterium]